MFNVPLEDTKSRSVLRRSPRWLVSGKPTDRCSTRGVASSPRRRTHVETARCPGDLLTQQVQTPPPPYLLPAFSQFPLNRFSRNFPVASSTCWYGLVALATSPLTCLSVRKVYCGKTAEWIRMPFGMVSGVCRGVDVLDGW